MAWVRLSPAERASVLRKCMRSTRTVADRWAAVSSRIKGYEDGSNGHGEEYLAGTLPLMRNLRLFAEALEAGGLPRIPQLSRSISGRWVARVFPQSTLDAVMMGGITCDVWIKPGETPTQGALYRRKASGDMGEGGVCVVLGAGNQSSIPPMDVLYKLVVDDEVCVLKMNPVNEQLGPIIAEALAPLIDGGFLQMAYGGIEQGQHLTDHELVSSIHITGSARAHDAIIWGPGEQGDKNKAAGTPRLDKAITSELGCVSPVLVVPGDWNEAALDYHARQVASMLAYNCGFNCNGARLIVMAKGWPSRDRFEQLVKDKLAQTPTRAAYYPNAKAAWERFTEKYPNPTVLGSAHNEDVLPWTVLEGVKPGDDEFALNNEPWCGILSFVDLEATTAEEFVAKAVPFANDSCWGSLSINVLIDPKTEERLKTTFDQAIADLEYGAIAINCWTGLNYGLVNATWGAFPGHPLDDVRSGQGVVHNGLLIDHPEKSVVRAPFIMKPTPAWFTDHRNNLALGKALTAFEQKPSMLKLPKVVLAALKG